MPQFKLLTLAPVTATGSDPETTAEHVRGLLDDTLARMDAEHPTGTVETGPATVLRRSDLTDTLTAIRSDALALRDGTALTRSAPAARIVERAERLLNLLDGKPAGDTATTTAKLDPDLVLNLEAALTRAREIQEGATSHSQHTQIGAWITRARAALDTRDQAAIRAALAEPYVTGSTR